jgi:hypothetical protein
MLLLSPGDPPPPPPFGDETAWIVAALVALGVAALVFAAVVRGYV